MPTASIASSYTFEATPTTETEIELHSSTPEFTVILTELQYAANDIAQIVAQFGTKMARILHRPHIKELLFDNSKLKLRIT